MPQFFKVDDLHLLLKKMVDEHGQTETAKRLEISRSFLNDVLNGRRNLTENLARQMGFEVIYRKVA